jgi:hypothetical protein
VIDLLRDSENRQTTSLLLARDRLAKNNHFDAQPASQGNASYNGPASLKPLILNALKFRCEPAAKNKILWHAHCKRRLLII